MTDSLDPNVHPDAERESEIVAAESEVYSPSEAVIASANVPDYLELRQSALKDIEAYWDARAKEFIDWYEPYEKVLDLPASFPRPGGSWRTETFSGVSILPG